jgi:hypothetical protein
LTAEAALLQERAEVELDELRLMQRKREFEYKMKLAAL